MSLVEFSLVHIPLKSSFFSWQQQGPLEKSMQNSEAFERQKNLENRVAVIRSSVQVLPSSRANPQIQMADMQTDALGILLYSPPPFYSRRWWTRQWSTWRTCKMTLIFAIRLSSHEVGRSNHMPFLRASCQTKQISHLDGSDMQSMVVYHVHSLDSPDTQSMVVQYITWFSVRLVCPLQCLMLSTENKHAWLDSWLWSSDDFVFERCWPDG